MAYNEKIAARIRASLSHLKKIEEKQMFGGLCFMVNGKMCIGVSKDNMMCRIDPALHEASVEKAGCRTMDFTHRPMKGFVFIDDTGIKSKKDFEYWVNLALDFNKTAKASKKKIKK